MNVYGFTWVDDIYRGEKYAREGSTLDFNNTTKIFTLTSAYSENNDSRKEIRTDMDRNYATSISAHIKLIQMNSHSKAQLLSNTTEGVNGFMISTGINLKNDRVSYWVELDNDNGYSANAVDYSKINDDTIASFPAGNSINKNLDFNITIVDNSFVYRVKDLDTNQEYMKTFNFLTDENSSVASFYQNETGETLTIKDKALDNIKLRSRTDYSYGGDTSDANSTIVEVHDAKAQSTSIDAYGYRWKDMKYRFIDARYAGDNNSIDYNSTSHIATLKVAFKETDTNALDSVDERDSRAEMRIKDYEHTVTNINATIKPIQANPYSWYQVVGQVWDEVNDRGIWTSFGLTKNGAKIFLGFINDGNYTSLLTDSNATTGVEIATFAQDVIGKQWNLDVKIVDNTIVYTVENLEDHNITKKVINFDTDLDSTAVAQYQTKNGEAISINNKAFNIERVRTRTDFLEGGDANLGGTTVMEVYDVKMDNNITATNYTFSGHLVNNDKNITTVEIVSEDRNIVKSSTVDGSDNFSIDFDETGNYIVILTADDGTVWYYNKYNGSIQAENWNDYINLSDDLIIPQISATEARTIDAYGYTWEDRHYRDARYSRVGNSVDFNTTENAFTLQSIFVENEESRTEIRASESMTSVSTHIQPIQMNPYSKVYLLTGVYQSSNDDLSVNIGVRNNDISYWVDFADGNGDYVDVADHSEVNTTIVSFPAGVTNKNLELKASIVDNSFVMKVKDLDTNTTYTRTFDFSTADVNSTAASIYQSQTGKVLSVEDKAFNGVTLRSRNDHRWGGDVNLGNTTILKIFDVQMDSTSIDAYGYTWENMKYSRPDARYLGVDNRVDFNASTNIVTLQAGFKETDANTQDSVDERDSKATMRVKDYNNPVKSLSATIKPIQANPYSWYQIAGTAWDEANARGLYTSLGLTKNGASIFLGFFNDGNYISLLPNENEIAGEVIATFGQDVTGNQWNLNISIVNNTIVYTVKNLDDNSTTVKVVDFATDINTTVAAQYQTVTGEALSLQNQAFNIERVRTRTDFTDGGDANLGGTTVMEVYDVYMGDVQDTADNDGDGIPDSIDPDDDNDGIPDSVEIALGLNPLDASDALLDLDDDGTSNIDEYNQGSQLNNAQSKMYTISLDNNWTLVSLPATATIHVSDINNTHIKIIRAFQNGQWHVWTYNSQPSTEQTLTELTENNGYWIKSDAPTTISYIGNALPLSIDFSTQNGEWKMYGSTQIDEPFTFLANHPNITVLWKYTNGTWQAISDDVDINNDLNAAGVGTLNFINSDEAFWAK